MQAVIVKFGTPSRFSMFGKALSPGAAYKLYTQGTAFKFVNGRNVKFGRARMNKFGSPKTRSRSKQASLGGAYMQALQDKNARESAKAIIIQKVARGKSSRKANRISPCPVCLAAQRTDNNVIPWECESHSVCRDCAQSIAQSQYQRCPQCRAPPKRIDYARRALPTDPYVLLRDMPGGNADDDGGGDSGSDNSGHIEAPGRQSWLGSWGFDMPGANADDDGGDSGSDNSRRRWADTMRWSSDNIDWSYGAMDRRYIMGRPRRERLGIMNSIPRNIEYWHNTDYY